MTNPDKTHEDAPESTNAIWDVPRAEQAVLYAALVNPRARKEILALMGAGGQRFFETVLCGELWAGIVERYPTGEFWDAEVIDWIERTQGDEVTGEQRRWVLDLFAQNTTSAQGVYWAKVVIQNGRRVIAERLGRELVEHPEFTPAEIIEKMDKATRDISPSIVAPPRTLKEIAADTLSQIELRGGQIWTGIKTVDRILRPVAPGNIMVVGAHPKRGKTSFAINVAVHNARRGKKVLLVSLEMSKAEMMERVASIYDGTLPSHTSERIRLGYESAGQLPIWMTEGHTYSVDDLTAAIESMRASGIALDLVIVDYLQLMNPNKKRQRASRQEEVADISRGLKNLATDQGVPLIVLSQLRRREKDDEDDPRPDQLRESGAIEQDASSVVLLSTKSMAGFQKRILTVDVALQRHGGTGKSEIIFDLVTQRMHDKADVEQDDQETML